MNKEDITAVVKQFAQAARNAMEAGFDGVEIHGKPPHHLPLAS
jgi:N-ethylmaleimide reductase